MEEKEIREYKSNSFSLLMKEKKYALEVYNALNGSDYKDPEVVEILDIEGAFSLTVRGDAGFIIGNDINLYEHQSTINPNMPLRFLIYISIILRATIDRRRVFSKKLLKISNPRFVVFYNGTDKLSEKTEYKLSDAFKDLEDEPNLELKCLCININPGYNEDIKSSCEGLMGYMRYIEMVRENKKTMDLNDAVKMAVDECIAEDILREFFMKNRKIIITNDPIDGTIEAREQYAREEGREEGREEERVFIISGALKMGRTPEQIAEFAGIPLEEVKKVQEEMLEEA